MDYLDNTPLIEVYIINIISLVIIYYILYIIYYILYSPPNRRLLSRSLTPACGGWRRFARSGWVGLRL